MERIQGVYTRPLCETRAATSLEFGSSPYVVQVVGLPAYTMSHGPIFPKLCLLSLFSLSSSAQRLGLEFKTFHAGTSAHIPQLISALNCHHSNGTETCELDITLLYRRGRGAYRVECDGDYPELSGYLFLDLLERSTGPGLVCCIYNCRRAKPPTITVKVCSQLIMATILAGKLDDSPKSR
jgi:hypothetical protein